MTSHADLAAARLTFWPQPKPVDRAPSVEPMTNQSPWTHDGSETTFPPFRCPPFATYVPVRTPAWMAHENHEQAKAALHPNAGVTAGEMWKHDGSWQRVLVIHPTTIDNPKETTL